MEKIIYLSLDNAIDTHNMIMEKTGGLLGEKEIGDISAPLEFIQIDDYYPTFEGKLTHLVYSVAKNHAFLDGNKRTSIGLGLFFLLLNGYPETVISKFVTEMEDLIVITVDNLLNKQELEEYIAVIISDNEYSDEMQIRLFNAMEESHKRFAQWNS